MAKDETADSAIARTVRVVTAPGGMNINWRKVSAAGAVIAGMSTIFGLQHRKWRYIRSFGVVLAAVAATVGRLQDRFVAAPETSAPETKE
jgi:hypothetical protein